MRVAMVILEYHPVTGGAQKQIASLAPLLRERGVELHVLTRSAAGQAEREVVDGVQVHRLPAPGPKASASAIFTAAAVLRLRALAPDVVHAHSLFSPTTVAMLARRSLHVPTVSKVLRGGLLGDVRRLRRKSMSRFRIAQIREHIDRFAVISSEIDDELEALRIPARRRVMIPNGVDVERFRPLSQAARDALRRELGLGKGPAVVFCGRLVPEKGVGRLLDAWRTVHARHPDATLLIVGGGALAQALASAAGAGVRFEGEQPDVAPWLRAADAAVLPSSAEGLSNAMLEAMAAGLPVVATRVGGALDCVEDGRSGLLVPPEDSSELATALDKLLADGSRARLGARGRAIAEDRYSLASVADLLTALYAELAGRRAQSRPVDAVRGDRGVAA